MIKAFFTLALLLWLPAAAPAAIWAENDYASGSNGLTKDSLTVFSRVSGKMTAGVNAAFYKDSAAYRKRIYSFRLPLMYSGPRYFVSLKPFIYPVSPETRSGAAGGKLYLLSSLSEEQDGSYVHLIVSGAWARQRARLNLNGSAERKAFQQSAFEVQGEKSFYGQFFFLASAAGFSKPAKASNANLIAPVLDQSELAYLGVFRQITALPEWVMTAQVARSMKPDFDSHLYAGYSKISFRRAARVNSALAGIKMNLNESSTIDFAYNAYKEENSAWKNYYKILLQVFF